MSNSTHLSIFAGTNIMLMGIEGPYHIPVEEAYKLYNDGTRLRTKDSFGNTVKIHFMENTNDVSDVCILRTLQGVPTPVPSHTRIFIRDASSTQSSYIRVGELTDTSFAQRKITPTLLLPNKKTSLEDNAWFLSHLEEYSIGYIIKVEEAKNTLFRMRQLHAAGVPCRPAPNKKDIILGELQPICFLMKLLTGQLASNDYDVFEEAYVNLSTRYIINPVLPTTKEVRHYQWDSGIIYEGHYNRNFLPLLSVQSAGEQTKYYTIFTETATRPLIETSWCML